MYKVLCLDKTIVRPTARSETRESCESHIHHIRNNDKLAQLWSKQLNTVKYNTRTALV